jgi:hypothetical protein
MLRLLSSAALCLVLPLGILGAQGMTAAGDSAASSAPPPPLALVQRPLRERAVSVETLERAASPTRREDEASRYFGDSSALVQEGAPSGGEVLGRIALATGGVIVGGLGAGLLGYAVLPHSDCDCDDPGLNEFVIGSIVGIAAGAALAAAIPKQRSTCNYGRRVLYGLVGAVAGGALGVIPPLDQRVITIPLGAAVGAGLVSAYCR